MKVLKTMITIAIVLGIFYPQSNVKVLNNKKEIGNISKIEKNDMRIETTVVGIENDTMQTNQKSGKKTINCYNGNHLLWSVSVMGRFNYNGKTSFCVSSSVSTYTNHSAWKVTNKYAWNTENQAFASATGVRNLLGIPVQFITKKISLTCSPNGQLY